jgi:hypothetical protein
MQQYTLAPESPPKECLGGGDIPLCAQQKIDSFYLLVGRIELNEWESRVTRPSPIPSQFARAPSTLLGTAPTQRRIMC